MAVSLIVASLALPCPTQHAALARGVFARRSALMSGALAATVALPAMGAKLLIDPIGAYSFGGGAGTQIGQVPENAMGKPNTGIYLLRECFDGVLPAKGLLEWYDAHLTPTFTAEFDGGKVVLDKAAYMAATADILQSFPDFVYTRTDTMEYNGPTVVTWTAVVRGTHSGKPYSPMPGVLP